MEMGKFFPDKAQVSIPLYYSYNKEIISPKYNPLDTDMELDDALESMSKQERDSVESIAVTKHTTRNFSISNARVGIKSKRHPMPYDPANFSFTYSHSHTKTTGETTVWETDDQWRGAINYTYSPVYKTWEPFKKSKSKSKWMNFPKAFGINYLPQTISFNTEMTRHYYELQERDMEDLSANSLPVKFNEQFLWNRDFSLRWDLTKNLHLNFQSATRAEIEEPYTPINKDLYPDAYSAWKDSVITSIKNLGTPLDYSQQFSASYHVPLNLIPILDWLNTDLKYDANYTWVRGTDTEDGLSLGNVITNNRTFNINGSFNLQKLYDHIPFLKKTNERFNKALSNKPKSTRDNGIKKSGDVRDPKGKDGGSDADDGKKQAALPKNKNTFEKEIVIKADTTLTVSHNKKSRRLVVTAKDKNGKTIPVKFKVVDDNKIKVYNKTDSALTMKISVTPKAPLDDKTWYKTAQVIARGLMMVRSINFTYRNQRQMSIPGFMPMVGDVFGQRKGDLLSPGLDFAFGLNGDDYVEKARENGWLLMSESVATPASTNLIEDLTLKMTLEPARDLKIDLNASRTETKAERIQYMYEGNPTTRSGQFTITTISMGSAFEGIGDAKNGYHSATFEKFCQSLEGFRQRVEARYAGATYPSGSKFAGQTFNPENGGMGLYSADVMIPAFIESYTSMGGHSLDLFPTLSRMLPNWTIRYSGLGKLSPFKELFKSVNLNHSYKSVFAIGSYASYSTWQSYMNDLGFITEATTGNPVPNSMFNISTVSINESFSPLLGIDVTLQNNLTCKLEYKKTRVLTLSTTSVQLQEARSDDWVIGMGYKINDFKLFGGGNKRRVKSSKGKGNSDSEDDNKGSSSSRTQSGSRGFNHDLNLRFDFSYRQQASLMRDIATMTSTASSGNTALKFSFNADYTLSRLMTMSFYYDQQVNTPLLSANSYPTTTRDFGLSLKFSLTR
jgi:cell surface protein SprA